MEKILINKYFKRKAFIKCIFFGQQNKWTKVAPKNIWDLQSYPGQVVWATGWVEDLVEAWEDTPFPPNPIYHLTLHHHQKMRDYNSNQKVAQTSLMSQSTTSWFCFVARLGYSCFHERILPCIYIRVWHFGFKIQNGHCLGVQMKRGWNSDSKI